MSVATLNGAASSSLARLELVPIYFDTELIVSPDDSPPPMPAVVENLLASIRERGQQNPGWVFPSPDLPPNKRLLLEGRHRFAAAKQLGIDFWAFDLGRFVPEHERIILTFHHNYSRRVMSREELAERAARYVELTGCSHADASTHLNVSPATLSRAFGDRRIPIELRPRADALCLSIRSIIAALPADLIEQALAFAETPDASGRKPTRNAVSDFVSLLNKGGGRTKTRDKPKTVTLRHGGRAVTLTVTDADTGDTAAADLRAIADKLSAKVLAKIKPEGWPFLYQ